MNHIVLAGRCDKHGRRLDRHHIDAPAAMLDMPPHEIDASRCPRQHRLAVAILFDEALDDLGGFGMLGQQLMRRTQKMPAHVPQLHLRGIGEQFVRALHPIDGNLALLGKILDRIRQVDFTLCIVRAATVKGFGERSGVKAVERRIHPRCGGNLFCLIGTARERNCTVFGKTAVGVIFAPLDTAGAEDVGIPCTVENAFDGFGADDLVAHRNDDRPRIADVLKGTETAGRRMASPLLLLLIGVEDSAFAVQSPHDAFRTMSDDNDKT